MEERNSTFFTDTHAHLASSRFEGEIDEVVARATENGVARIVSIACDLEDSETNFTLAERFPNVVAPTVGIHPLYVHEIEGEDWLARLEALARHPRTAAIGEIGLDYYHPPQDGSTEDEWRRRQWTVFERLLQLSIDLGLPAVIHQRNSADDVAAVLRQFPRARAVLHCFSGSAAEAETALEMGHFLSFTGIVTFPSADEVRAVVAITPQDRIMVETDCPYLAPVPFRGKRCEPHMVSHTANKIAEVRNTDPEEFAAVTSGNAQRFFAHLAKPINA